LEVGVTANEILSLIYQMKGGLSLQPMRYSKFEAYKYNIHGHIAINEGTEESARRAVAYFEKCLAVNKKIGNGQGVATTKSNIADAISMYEGGNDNKELLTASQQLYLTRSSSRAKLADDDVISIENSEDEGYDTSNNASE
jgi:hypothetical protein